MNTTTWPQKVDLHAVALSWQLKYDHELENQDAPIELTPLPKELIFSGGIAKFDDCRQPLNQWLEQQAKAYIEPWLHKLSKDCQLSYEKVAFRGQKSLWGSCSEDQNISLNYKLLLLPARLVRYVLIHELCHTRHLDHSKDFWHLVSRHEPNYARLKKELKKAESYLPDWAKR